MTGQIAQMVNLITHYNSGNTKDDLHIENSTYQYCNTLKFVYFRKKLFGGIKEVQVANNTKEWFKYLEGEGVQSLQLLFQPDNSLDSDHKLAGALGGGGFWFIEARKESSSDLWQSKWEVKPDKKEGDQRIWNITYGLIGPDQKHFEHPEYDIGIQKGKLKSALTTIADFAASDKSTQSWEKTFNNAKAALEMEKPVLKYYKDLTAEGSLPTENLQLLVAASRSFVFGGMGSWNDVGWFENEERSKKYDEVSAELYEVMNDSIIAAVNGK